MLLRVRVRRPDAGPVAVLVLALVEPAGQTAGARHRQQAPVAAHGDAARLGARHGEHGAVREIAQQCVEAAGAGQRVVQRGGLRGGGTRQLFVVLVGIGGIGGIG